MDIKQPARQHRALPHDAYKKREVRYSSRSSTQAGWDMVNVNKDVKAPLATGVYKTPKKVVHNVHNSHVPQVVAEVSVSNRQKISNRAPKVTKTTASNNIPAVRSASPIVTNPPELPLPKLNLKSKIERRFKKVVKKSRVLLPNNTPKRILAVAMAAIVMSMVSANMVYVIQNRPIKTEQSAEAAGVSTDATNSTGVNDGTTDSLNDVDETEVTNHQVASYQVAQGMPQSIRIDSIGVYSRIIRVGVNTNNEMLTPKSIYTVGWYEGSNKPNEDGGVVFMNGHVSGPTSKGVFYNLKKVNPGDIISVTVGGGQVVKYRVEAKESVPADQVDMNKALKPFKPGTQGLNLMTCTGSFNRAANEYNDRLIVYSTRI